MTRTAHALFAALGVASALQGTTLVRASLDELARTSTTIVRGRISGTYCISTYSGIYTKIRVKVSEQWKGVEAASLEVTVPGGTCHGVSQTVSGAPAFVEGSEHVFFLWSGRARNLLLLGLGQGVLDIHINEKGETVVSRGGLDGVMLDAVTGRVVRDEPFSMRMSDFNLQVRRALGRGAAQ